MGEIKILSLNGLNKQDKHLNLIFDMKYFYSSKTNNLLKALKVAERHSPQTKIKLLSNNAGKILSTMIKYGHYILETLFLTSGLKQTYVQIKHYNSVKSLCMGIVE